ncbi:methionine synthase [Corynebacterium sp. HMSC04H06]|nr:methionine synthase [Corynebacterium sp. HMSC04H06]OFS21141.1 methionine synthase [Corynebacterium sp. HMSC04H06]
MTGFGLGPMPGTSMPEAADIVLGETGDLPHLAQLPDRGLGSDAIGRTAGLVEFVTVDRGPRAWQMTDRPQLLTRRVWDRMERDLDEMQAVWGEGVPQVKIQAVGPWSLTAAIELANGHRVITDSGARRDLFLGLQEGISRHAADVARRFGAQVVLQLDEPYLGQILAGTLPGVTDFEDIAAVPAEVAADTLGRFQARYLHLDQPQWELARTAQTVLLDLPRLDNPKDLDGLGQHLDSGARVGLGITAGDAVAGQPDATRGVAIAIARLLDRLGLPRTLLTHAVDVYPARPNEPARDYRLAHRVATMLERDAGDL